MKKAKHQKRLLWSLPSTFKLHYRCLWWYPTQLVQEKGRDYDQSSTDAGYDKRLILSAIGIVIKKRAGRETRAVKSSWVWAVDGLGLAAERQAGKGSVDKMCGQAENELLPSDKKHGNCGGKLTIA